MMTTPLRLTCQVTLNKAHAKHTQRTATSRQRTSESQTLPTVEEVLAMHNSATNRDQEAEEGDKLNPLSV